MEIFYGWAIVALCTQCKLLKCFGQNNIMSFTVPHLLEEFELSHSELATLFSIATASSSLIQPWLGRCMDQFGARICIPTAQLVFCITLLCFSMAQRLAWTWLLYFMIALFFLFLRGLSLGACETFPNACIQKWFIQKRGRAMAIQTTVAAIGNACLGFVASAIVAGPGWRWSMRCGALSNLAMTLPSLIWLRSKPEDCGMTIDGLECSSSSPKKAGKLEEERLDDKAPEESEAREVGVQQEMPSGLWPLYAFTFVYEIIHGGCDFEMSFMVKEASHESENGNVLKPTVDLARHIFLPVYIVIAVGNPCFGELVDRRKKRGLHTSAQALCVCGVCTCISTISLSFTSSPSVGVFYGLLRGFNQGIFMILLLSGIAFAEAGIDRELIGQALGMNAGFSLVGTAVGPFVYGVGYDVFGSFRGTLWATSIPPLLLGLVFGYRACRRQSPAHQSDTVPKRTQYAVVAGEEAPKGGQNKSSIPPKKMGKTAHCTVDASIRRQDNQTIEQERQVPV
eukprot:TRINITY_DN3507_c1_g1_i3.p1 TRINITY_DN3507_c1_g1~~TRINITY_DN3507_c1_g1_i3.p1  ORF type:complete len:510 (+),score=46.23 TRINITY_DN3507_c1_g1_i3:127-1656(+)